MMDLPKKIDKKNIFEFFLKLSENFSQEKKLTTHIKLPEYSISIPQNRDEYFNLLKDHNWEDISYISFFVKEMFFINFDFMDESIQITCDEEELEEKIKKLIITSFKED